MKKKSYKTLDEIYKHEKFLFFPEVIMYVTKIYFVFVLFVF